MLAFTGCRISELDNFYISGLKGNRIYWRVGKNQKGLRMCILPQWYLNELMHYRSNPEYKFDSKHLFGIKACTFQRRFSKEIRGKLPNEWQEMGRFYTNRGWDRVYLFQLKGLRKTWATHCFSRYWHHYGSPSVALEATCKEMKHSNKGITLSHYIEELDLVRGREKQYIHEIIKPEVQLTLGV